MNQTPMNQSNMSQGKPNFASNMAGFQQSAHWTDEEIIIDMLTTEKTLAGFYAATACETSCQNLRQVLMDNMTSTVSDQYQVFDQMRQRNWYPVKNATPQEVQDAKGKFAQMKTEITQ